MCIYDLLANYTSVQLNLGALIAVMFYCVIYVIYIYMCYIIVLYMSKIYIWCLTNKNRKNRKFDFSFCSADSGSFMRI